MSDTPPDMLIPPPLDERGHVAVDWWCAQCDYNLRGLPPDGDCPECGTPIERARGGPDLKYANPLWLGEIVCGFHNLRKALMAMVALMLLASILSGKLAVVMPRTPKVPGIMVLLGLLLPCYVIFRTFLAVQQMTQLEPGRGDFQRRWPTRRLLRDGSVALLMLLGTVAVLAAEDMHDRMQVAGVTAVVMSLLALLTAVFVALQLAPRMSWPRRVRQFLLPTLRGTIVALIVLLAFKTLDVVFESVHAMFQSMLYDMVMASVAWLIAGGALVCFWMLYLLVQAIEDVEFAAREFRRSLALNRRVERPFNGA